MKRDAGDSGIEAPVLFQVLDPTAPEYPTSRSARVDGHHVIAGPLERTGEPTVATSDFDHTRRRCRKLRLYPFMQPASWNDVLRHRSHNANYQN
jgi:hypothetical protein